MKGKRRRRRQKKRWEDNIKECSGLFLPAQLGQLKTGQEGKGLLQIHVWCPDDLLRLWDRIENRNRKETRIYGYEHLLFYQQKFFSLRKFS